MTPVATVAIELVPAMHVSSAAPCRVPGTTMFIDGNDYIRNGMLRVDDWQLPYVEVNTPASPQEVVMNLTPRKITQGSGWSIRVNTYRLDGATLMPGIYLDAERASFATTGHPGLEVTGNSRGCNILTGAFEIHELSITSSGLSAATISFEQHCEAGVTLLEGCFRYEK
jgi:hypothetical protein